MAASDLQQLKMTFLTLLLGVVSVAKATTMADVVTTVTVPTTIDPRFVRLHHKSSTTGSITMNWTVPNSAEVDGYRVQSWKTGSDSKTISPTLAWNETEYVITDLLRNTDYKVCVYAMVPTNDTDERSCLNVFTIPLIRWDSLLALLLVILAILILVLLGIICWRRELKKHKGDNNSEDENKKSESSQPILLAPPVDNRPRSSIEDEDIPYITPPIEELENDDREYAMTHRKKSKEDGTQ